MEEKEKGEQLVHGLRLNKGLAISDKRCDVPFRARLESDKERV